MDGGLTFNLWRVGKTNPRLAPGQLQLSGALPSKSDATRLGVACHVAGPDSIRTPSDSLFPAAMWNHISLKSRWNIWPTLHHALAKRKSLKYVEIIKCGSETQRLWQVTWSCKQRKDAARAKQPQSGQSIYGLLVITVGTPLLRNSDNSPLQIWIGNLPEGVSQSLACNARCPFARHDYSKPDFSTFIHIQKLMSQQLHHFSGTSW